MSFVLKHTNVEQPDPTAQRHATITSACNEADLVTLNEAGKDHAFIIARPLFSTYTVGENAILWRSNAFALVDKGQRRVMRGGRLGALIQRARRRDRRRRGPSRYVLWAVLEERASGREVMVATHHAIAKADTQHPWRKALRRVGFRNTGREILRGMRRNPSAPLLLTGDLNAKGPVNFLGPREHEVPTPATLGRLRYDRLFTASALSGSKVSLSHVGTFKTHSDHKGLRATAALQVRG